jgi:large subunit ribosomal protein L16
MVVLVSKYGFAKNKNKMLLQPKRTTYRKYKKGVLPNLEHRANKLEFGIFGLKALESGCISARQIESARQAINRKIKRNGRVWIRIFPNLPITSKPIEVRMGKGKGSVSHWVARVGAGALLFEIEGISKKLAESALKVGATKLPVKTTIIS